MDQRLWTRWIVVCWCIGSLVIPQSTRAADPLPARSAVRDISLDTQGSLRGTLVNTEGKPQGERDVVLLRGNEVLGTAKTQADGTFAIKQVRSGTYELASAKAVNLVRVWQARSAPPSAQPTAMIVEGPVVRGQEWSPLRRALILSGVVITSGVIGGVIGYNIQDDDAS